MMYDFESLSPSELVVLSTLLTFLLAEDRDADELNVLGNFVVSTGGLILTWAAQMQLLKSSKNDGKEKKASLDDIVNQIKNLQERINLMAKGGI